MVSPPTPPDEAKRIQNLDSYRLLDTPFEPVFDEIVSLAAKICGVPYAMISLVDRKRQWFKAVHGLKDVRETPRDISFCGHAILQDEVFYVPETRADVRFADNPFVTGELAIRVYAGMPLESDEGFKLGTLCVLSDQPKPLDPLQLDSLKQLSHVLTALFTARKREARFALLGQVLDELNDEIVLADPSTLECTYANASAHKALPHAESLAGTRLYDIAGAFSSSEHMQRIAALQSGEKERIELEVRRAGESQDNETENVVELRMQRLTSAADSMLVAIGHDISERKKLDKVRAELHESLERHHRELSRAYTQLSDELAIAREMQLRFLPAPKCIGNVCFDWLFRASSYLGGDIFDYFPLDKRHLCFHLIDVSGHGVAAALLAFSAQREMFSARSEILAVLRENNGDIGRAASMSVEAFNRKFAAMNESSLYLTMIFGILDIQSGETALVQAGHPAPLYRTPDAPPAPIGHGGLPIGILDQAEYEAHRVRMVPGARLYLYSDGITDCANPDDEFFGQQRMEKLLMRKDGAPLAEVRDTIGHALIEWQGGKESFDDDVTLVMMEYRAPNQTMHAEVMKS